jgi:hypothetical protein
MKTNTKQNNDWIKRFDKRFTRKSKGEEDKGKYRDDWFVRETTAEQLKSFIQSEIDRAVSNSFTHFLEVSKKLEKIEITKAVAEERKRILESEIMKDEINEHRISYRKAFRNELREEIISLLNQL